MHRLAYINPTRRNSSRHDLQFIQYSYCTSKGGGKMALKIVDKFEFLESEGKTFDGVDIIPARHTVLHQPFTLKKLSLKEDSNGRYSNLVNELVVLKEVTGEWVIKCHKMLKTSNNLYLVYDKMGECTLATLLDAKQPPSQAIKESIASQLLTILSELKSKGIVNLNITPQTIQIITPKASSGTSSCPIIRLNNFEYAIMMRQVIDQKILNNLPVSQFKPPELDLTPPSVGYHCDLYSVGKILELLGFGKEGRWVVSDRSEKMKQIGQVVGKMIVQDYRKRISLEEVKILFQSKHTDSHQRQVQRSKTLTNTWKNKEESQNNEESIKKATLITRKLTNTISTQDSHPRQVSSSSNFRSYCLQILKRRNFSIFLLKCCQYCSQLDLTDIDSTIMVSFLLLKKSTQVIAQLCKFLMTGHDPYIKIPEKQLSSFFKTHDYFRLQSQATKEMSLSKKHLNIMINKINQTYGNLLEQPNFAKEIKHQEINNQYFKQIVMSFLRKNIKNPRIDKTNNEILTYFLLMSYISDFGTYEKMFDELISEQVIELSGQTLLIKISQMSSSQIIEKLKGICLLNCQK